MSLINNKSLLGTNVSEIEKTKKDIERFEENIKEHSKLLEKKSECDVELGNIEIDIKQFNENNNTLNRLTGDRCMLLYDVLEIKIELQNKYKAIIDAFSTKKGVVLKDIDFVSEIKYDIDEFIETAEDLLDNRKITVSAKSISLRNIIDSAHNFVQGSEESITHYVNEAYRLQAELFDKVKSSKSITKEVFYNFIYKDYFEILPHVNYKGVNLKNLSLGQKATVLLKIYLAQGDKPIIIDSHDDHLDNEFIMGELVDAIKEAKNHRQVILVSNNGNVVINSDAEQVVIANRNEQGAISYYSGSLENPAIRNAAIKVLEGGKNAFRKRHQKYRMGDELIN